MARSTKFKRRRSQAARGLPIIDSCDDCGACCREQESPPGYLMIQLHGPESAYDPEDARRFNALPQSARDELQQYSEYMAQHNEHPNGGVCIWFEEETRQCKHYELRPSICRDVLAVGDDACRGWREQYFLTL